MKNQDIQALSETAFKYGPFFFSILFVIFLTRWAYKKYSTALTTTPALSEIDLKAHRVMFFTTFCFGLGLVIISISWWWYQPRVYIFKGRIKDLPPQDELAADTYYIKRIPRGPMSFEDKVGLLRDEEFVIVGSQPFRQGQQFEIDYSKDHHPRSKLWLPYTADEEESTYEVGYDLVKGPFLKRVAPDKPPISTRLWDWQLERSAFAETPLGKKAVVKDLPQPTLDDRKVVAVLQDPRSNVSDKINAIGSLASRPANLLKADLAIAFPEPLAQTIFDLTQHSDAELASRAKALANSSDIDGYLVQELSSTEKARRVAAGEILLRISGKHAQAILARVDLTKYDELKQLGAEVVSGAKRQILKPTASEEGDRYYVKATWSPSDQAAADCLVKVFNEGLITTRTPAQEKALMAGRNQRFVYWYSKSWAMAIADDIKRCGANAEFVLGY